MYFGYLSSKTWQDVYSHPLESSSFGIATVLTGAPLDLLRINLEGPYSGTKLMQ